MAEVKPSTFLEDALTLLRHKDVMRRQIKDITIVSDSQAHVVFKTKEQDVYAVVDLDKAYDGVVFCDNTRANVEKLLALWDDFCKYPLATITFLDAQQGVHWSICPFLHNKITEPKKLAPGLISLFQGSY